ncbi:hypothetical protein J5X84_35260 [Streptosporangiaceae bacterium NEAU-GS5]|nr:hypothetical protein [Streptosporangiaceae bacterium NEAU-GS5]
MSGWKRAVAVPFTGQRDGEGPMTWGQRHIWRLTEWLDDGDPYFNMAWTLAVPGRPGLDRVLGALRALLERHESLRTTWEGRTQRITRSGTLTVDLYEAGDRRPLALAKELAEELAAKGFRYDSELPMRCALVLADGQPRAAAFAFTHMAVDAWSLDVIASEWRPLIAGEQLSAPACQPLDLTGLERDCDRELRYWRSHLERVPQRLVDREIEPEEPRYVRIGMESAAAGVAARAIARRCSVSTTSVLGTACATVMADALGRRTAVMQWIVANRHQERTRSMVGTMTQDGLFVLDLPDAPDQGFPAAVRAGHRQALAAYRHACYDPYAMRALRDDCERARGGPIDLSAYFNDGRIVADWPNLPDGDLTELAAKTRTFFVGAWPHVDGTVFFATGQATHTCQLYLLVDTAHLPRETAYAMLAGVEQLLIKNAVKEP